MVEEQNWVRLFEKAIREEFDEKSKKIIEKTKKELEQTLKDTTENVMNKFIGNVYFNYGENPKYGRPQITIVLPFLEENKDDSIHN